jgi:hypothetical protein
VRQLVRNILAVESVSGLPRERLLRLTLQWSLPHRSGLTVPDEAVIHGAHRAAWESAFSEGPERWLYDFHSEPDLAKKLTLLLETCDCPDTGTLAVSQLLASETLERKVVFALSLYPALLAQKNPPIGEEGIQDLGRLVNPILELDAEVIWWNANHKPLRPPEGGRWEGIHPTYEAALQVLRPLIGNRRRRTEQVFLYLLAQKQMTKDPQGLATLLSQCIAIAKKFHGTSSN